MSIGITGRDTVAEHEAAVESGRRERAESGASTPVEGDRQLGCEEVMDLGFGACKLQVQVPEKGQYVEPKDLIGKNVGTSFVHLAEEYFANLESEKEGVDGQRKKLRTNIIELSGSVEAACALGVADGIVDLVGTSFLSNRKLFLTAPRIRRNNESSRPKSNRHRRLQRRRPHQIKTSLQPHTRRSHRLSNPRRHQ